MNLLNYEGQEVQLISENGSFLIPVKRICELIDVDYQTQNNWLKKHKIFSQLYSLDYTTGADGKQYKMSCIGLLDCLLWLSSISNNRRREGSYEKQMAVLMWLRSQFMELHKSIEVMKRENDYELALQNKKVDLEVELAQNSNRMKEIKKEINNIDKTIEDVRSKRFTGQTALQFPKNDYE